MGLVTDTAITVDADLLKYAFEQQIANLIRPGSGVTFAELHKGGANELIARLRAKSGYTDAQLASITNLEDLKRIVVAWLLSKIFAGMGGPRPGEREAAAGKAAYYADQFEKLLATTAVKLSTDSELQDVKRSLPVLVNLDAGSMFPALGTFPTTYAPFGRPGGAAQSIVNGTDDIFFEGE